MNPIGFFQSMADKEGVVVHRKLGKRNFYLINDPDVIRDMLIVQGSNFEKFPRISRTQGLFGEGLLTSEDPLHLRQRKLMQPAFQRERLQGYARTMIERTQSLTAGWRDGNAIAAHEEMSRLTLDIVSRSLFSSGAEAHALEVAEKLDIVLRMLNQLVMPWGSLLLRMPVPQTLRYRRALRRLDEIVYGVIDSRLESGAPQDDLLQMLLDTREQETGAPMDRLQVRDEVMTIFVAGHETVANALLWSLYLLGWHPEERSRMEREVDEVCGARGPQAEDYLRLEYTQRVFMEAMRLYPPVWILGRRALTDFTSGSFHARAGSILLVCMAVLHRRPEFFPKPDEFQPDRWLEPANPKFAYLPFGAGARLCIGERYAWMEGVLCLATMAQRFRLDIVEGQAIEPLGLLTLRPKNGLWMRVQQRTRRGSDTVGTRCE